MQMGTNSQSRAPGSARAVDCPMGEFLPGAVVDHLGMDGQVAGGAAETVDGDGVVGHAGGLGEDVDRQLVELVPGCHADRGDGGDQAQVYDEVDKRGRRPGPAVQVGVALCHWRVWPP